MNRSENQKNRMGTRRFAKNTQEHIEICDWVFLATQRSKHAVFLVRSRFMMKYPG